MRFFYAVIATLSFFDNQNMANIVSYVGLFVAVVLIIWGLSRFFAWKARIAREKAAEEKRRAEAESKGFIVHCPLCQSTLKKGENIISRVYRPMNTPEQYCIVNGCPHCYPVLEAGLSRVCPVCGKSVPLDGYLVSHLFCKPNGKRHVHITGCSEESHYKGKNLMQ